jgi:glycosyltransferase involved in cell wall biosynthesis
MRICLISVEIFAWGKYGGFGRATRTIGRELAARGVEVFAVVPRRPGQAAVEHLDGITVLGFSPYAPWTATELLKHADADIYHSCEPSLATYLAMKALPDRKHMVTVRDPRDFHDWRLEYERPSLSRLQVAHNYLYENNLLVRRCIRRMDAVYTIAKYLVPKVKSMYGLSVDPAFLPTPVHVPELPAKAETPTVCYLARLDRRKRPELFLELPSRFPDVQFVMMGKSRDVAWEQGLRTSFGSQPNLQWAGFIDQFGTDQHAATLARSWVMVNTATREALPNAFLESSAQGCAILSHVDPDSFASHFGYHAAADDFADGLRFLLENDRWKQRGERGYEYVRDTFATEVAMTLHFAAYETVLATRSSRAVRSSATASRS